MAWMGMLGSPGRLRNDLLPRLAGRHEGCRCKGGELPQDTSRNVATTANRDHQIGVEGVEDFIAGLLA